MSGGWRALALSATLAIAADAGADPFPARPKAQRKWPPGPTRDFLEMLQRPDNWKRPWQDPDVKSCCDAADTVDTKFKVEAGEGPHPEDRWYAWLNEQWVAIPPDVIVPDHAPDGRAYLFVIDLPADLEGHSGFQVIACFVRPRGGL